MVLPSGASFAASVVLESLAIESMAASPAGMQMFDVDVRIWQTRPGLHVSFEKHGCPTEPTVLESIMPPSPVVDESPTHPRTKEAPKVHPRKRMPK